MSSGRETAVDVACTESCRSHERFQKSQSLRAGISAMSSGESGRDIDIEAVLIGCCSSHEHALRNQISIFSMHMRLQATGQPSAHLKASIFANNSLMNPSEHTHSDSSHISRMCIMFLMRLEYSIVILSSGHTHGDSSHSACAGHAGY